VRCIRPMLLDSLDSLSSGQVLFFPPLDLVLPLTRRFSALEGPCSPFPGVRSFCSSIGFSQVLPPLLSSPRLVGFSNNFFLCVLLCRETIHASRCCQTCFLHGEAFPHPFFLVYFFRMLFRVCSSFRRRTKAILVQRPPLALFLHDRPSFRFTP